MPRCIKCNVSVFDKPLYRRNEKGPLPEGQWICSDCGGLSPGKEVDDVIRVITQRPTQDEKKESGASNETGRSPLGPLDNYTGHA